MSWWQIESWLPDSGVIHKGRVDRQGRLRVILPSTGDVWNECLSRRVCVMATTHNTMHGGRVIPKNIYWGSAHSVKRHWQRKMNCLLFCWSLCVLSCIQTLLMYLVTCTISNISRVFRPHYLRAVHTMRPIATDVACSMVCAVSVLGTWVSCAKRAELIAMPFAMGNSWELSAL